MITDDLSPWKLLTVTGALLAFLVGFATVVGRERKSPYLINSVLWIFVFCIFAALVALFSALVAGEYQRNLLYLGALVLLWALGLTCWHVYMVAIRFTYFVDSVHPRTFLLWRLSKDIYRRITNPPHYEHNPEPIPAHVVEKIKGYFRENVTTQGKLQDRQETVPVSLAIALEHHGQANQILADLIELVIAAGLWVQYTATSRHPCEFMFYLHERIKDRNWRKAADKIVVVDAYTRHFGFADSIYSDKTRKLRQLNVECINSAASYAGVHTAASRAFNHIKRRAGGNIRQPVLVIYEDSFALADLESPQQYRVFIRHVLPSERLWGGMFTVFVETAQPASEWDLLQSYGTLCVDLRTDQGKQAGGNNGQE